MSSATPSAGAERQAARADRRWRAGRQATSGRCRRTAADGTCLGPPTAGASRRGAQGTGPRAAGAADPEFATAARRSGAFGWIGDVSAITSGRFRAARTTRADPEPAGERAVGSHQCAGAAGPDKAAAESPTAASTIGVTDVRRVWPEVLTAVQRQRRTTQILLESATVVGVDAGVLQVAMPSAGMARRVLEPANSDLLRAALKELLGVDWTIRCEAVGAGGQRTPAAARQGDRPGARPAQPSAVRPPSRTRLHHRRRTTSPTTTANRRTPRPCRRASGTRRRLPSRCCPPSWVPAGWTRPADARPLAPRRHRLSFRG